MKRGTLVVILTMFAALSWGNGSSAGIEQGPTFHTRFMLSPFLFGCPAAGVRLQILNENSGDPKAANPAWKQGVALGSETVGAGAGTFVCALAATAAVVMGNGGDNEARAGEEALLPYTITNGLITSTVTWGVGRLWGQRFSWPGSSTCAAAGAALTCGFMMVSPGYPDITSFVAEVLVLPIVGAVLGGNLLRW